VLFPVQWLPAPVTALGRRPNRQVLAGLADGTVWELAWEGSGQVLTEKMPLQPDVKAAVRAVYCDTHGATWVVAGGRIGRIAAPAGAWQRHWQEAGRLPAGNHDIIFAREGGRLYTAGGKTYFGFPATDWVNLDEIWQYEIDDHVWRLAPPMLRPGKAYSGIAALAGEIWLLGGYLRAGSGTRAVADVEVYSPRSRHVRPGPALDLARGQVVALTLGKRLYAIGGASDERPLAMMSSIGAAETRWRDEVPPPGPVEQASGCVLDGRLYVAAGHRNGCPGLYVFDPVTHAWSTVAHPTGRAPQAPLCAAFGGEVWVLGGTGVADGHAVYRYDPRRQAWRRGPDLPLPVSWGAAIDLNGRLCVAGGAYRSDDLNDYFNSDRVFLLRPEAATAP